MKQTKDEYCKTGVRLPVKTALEAAQVIKTFIKHRQTNNGIYQISIQLDLKEYAKQQRGAVSDSK